MLKYLEQAAVFTLTMLFNIWMLPMQCSQYLLQFCCFLCQRLKLVQLTQLRFNRYLLDSWNFIFPALNCLLLCFRQAGDVLQLLLEFCQRLVLMPVNLQLFRMFDAIGFQLFSFSPENFQQLILLRVLTPQTFSSLNLFDRSSDRVTSCWSIRSFSDFRASNSVCNRTSSLVFNPFFSVAYFSLWSLSIFCALIWCSRSCVCLSSSVIFHRSSSCGLVFSNIAFFFSLVACNFASSWVSSSVSSQSSQSSQP